MSSIGRREETQRPGALTWLPSCNAYLGAVANLVAAIPHNDVALHQIAENLDLPGLSGPHANSDPLGPAILHANYENAFGRPDDTCRRSTNARSVERTGQFTCGYMPGASAPELLGTSNSTDIVRVF